MMTIWKYELKPGLTTYKLPQHARLLSVAMQRGQPCMWAVVNPSAPKEDREILLTGTGHDFPVNDYGFVGTMLTEDQNFVFHVLEKLSPVTALLRAVL